jgi:hypothetical protein
LPDRRIALTVVTQVSTLLPLPSSHRVEVPSMATGGLSTALQESRARRRADGAYPHA